MTDSKDQIDTDSASGSESYRKQALAHIQELRDHGIEPFPHTFRKQHGIGRIREDFDGLQNEEAASEQVVTAGRVMANRNSGMFIVIEDPTGRIQVYTPNIKELEGDPLMVVRGVKLGDIIGVTGTPVRTRRGELSIRNEGITPLSTAILSMPKHQAIEDPEERVRRRALYLITSPEARERLKVRSKMITRIRAVLDEDDWLEVETPSLQTIPGGAEARPFITHHNTLNQDMYLRIATELHLKQLIVSGLHEKVFEIGKVFRNEGVSKKHNPEFTTIEAYQAYADYNDMMDLTEKLVKDAARNVCGIDSVEFGGHEIQLTGEWQKRPMLDLIQEATGTDFGEMTAEQALDAARGLGLELEGNESWGAVVLKVFEVRCEEKLIQPTFVIDYPAEICPLTKKHRTNDRLAERFELFIAGMEFANAYSELSDPVYQREQFEKQMALREQGDEEAHMLDEEFLQAIEHGFPPTGGLGIGIDRLAMLLTGADNIREIIAFPTLKNQ